MIGTNISHYRILEKLGEGGMGVVYKARDNRLNRTVALKFLPPAFLQDKVKKTRLLQEAQAAAAINHPNICTVYEIDESADHVFIAMEYIEGQNLKEIIQAGPLEIAKAIDISLQIAAGLQEIHDQGMVHRDIKSENILLTKKDQVKIMDFGLVRASGVKDKISTEDTTSGTVAYMSPEQIRGEELDRRSDIWSWGIVLYEMITAQLPFKTDRKDMSVIYSILDEEPQPPQQYRPEISMETLHILNRSLEKDPADRYQDVPDLVIDLKRALREITQRPPLKTSPQPSTVATAGIPADAAGKTQVQKIIPPKGLQFRPLKYIIPTGLLLLAATLVIFLLKPFSAESPAPLKIVPLACSVGPEISPAFSPDGNLVSYAWNENSDQNNYQIYVKMTGTLNPLKLTDGTPGPREWPAFSPDGRTIIFQQHSGRQAGIYKVAALGGTVQLLLDLHDKYLGAGLDWSPDGTSVIYSYKNSITAPYCLHILSLSTSESRQIVFPPAGVLGDDLATVSPDGNWIAFQRNFTMDSSAIFIIPFSGDAGQENYLTSDHRTIYGLAWSEDGHEIIFNSNRGGTLGLWRISAKGGQPEPVAAGVEGVIWFSYSRKGRRLVYCKGGSNGLIWKGPLPGNKGGDLTAAVRRLIATNQSLWMGRISPDGKKISFTSSISGQSNIWVCDSDGSNHVQLTGSADYQSGAPYWSPDNFFIVFDSDRYGQRDIFVMDANGGQLRRLTADPADERIPSWSRDGRWIYFTSNRGGKSAIWKVPAGGGEAVKVLNEEGWMNIESPDGRWLYSHAWGKLWRLSLESGEKQYLLDGVLSAGWYPEADGFYYITQSADAAESYLQFQNYKSNTVRSMVLFKKPVTVGCLDVSADQKSFILSGSETGDYDIYLVENFSLN